MSARLLLVDDDPNILDTGRDILEDAGYTVDSALSMAQALERLHAQAPDVMLVDLNLKDGTGLELARQARAIHPTLKVILLTGEATVDLSPASGAVCDYLIKPVDPRQLIDTIKKHL